MAFSETWRPNRDRLGSLSANPSSGHLSDMGDDTLKWIWPIYGNAVFLKNRPLVEVRFRLVERPRALDVRQSTA